MGQAKVGTSTGLLPESDFAASFSEPVQLTVQLPIDDTNPEWSLNGSAASVTCDVKLTIKDFKAKLSSTLGGMPGNKMQLKHAKWGFLKDSLTLAHFNLGPGSALELVTKKRGGR